MAKGSTFAYQTTVGERWGYVVELPAGADGRRRQKRKRGYADEEAAYAAMQEEMVGRRKGTWVDPATQPLAAYLDEWLATTEASRKPASNASYAYAIARLIAPGLGGVPLGALGPMQVQRWVNALAPGRAPSSVRYAHAVLSMALRQAVRWRLVATNAAEGVRLPKPPPSKPAAEMAWTAEQARAFLAEAERAGHGALWRFLLDSGARIGEALALAWDDVDLEAGTVLVRRTLTRGRDHRLRLGDSTKSGEPRTVALVPATVAALRAHRAAQHERRLRLGGAWHRTDLVFDRGDGRPGYPGTEGKRCARFAAAAGVPPLSPHGCRHTAATLLRESGVPLEVVAARLGHRRLGVTAGAYVHVTPEAARAAARVLGELLGDGTGGP